MNIDSASTSDRIAPSRNPSVFRTASSLVRSRTDCAIVLAATSPNMNSTTDEMATMIAPMSPTCEANPSTKPFSVVVSRLESGVGEHLVELAAQRDGLRRIRDAHHVPSDQPLLRGRAGVLDQVVVLEEELRLVDALAGVVDPGDVELPARTRLRLVDRAAQRHPVADLPLHPLGQVPADDRALPIAGKRLPLLGRHDELRIDARTRLRDRRRSMVSGVVSSRYMPLNHVWCVTLSTPGTRSSSAW